MTSVNFCYWLQGWFELNGTIDHREGATPETMAMIKAHLSLVFAHEIDPSQGGPEEQAKLNAIHNPPSPAPGHSLNSLASINEYNEQARKEGKPLMRC